MEAIDNSLGTIGYVQINGSEWDSRGAVEKLARSIAEDDAFYVKNGRSLGKRRDIVKARFRNTLGSYLLALIDFSKPLVAGFQGEISAEYLGLTLVFDARIATADTTISFDIVHTGMPSSPGITDLMPRYIGIGKTLALANQGTTICASDALGLGLINQIVDDTEDLTSTCLDYTRTLTSQRSDIVHFNRRHMLPPRDHFKAALGRYYEAMSAALIE